MDATEANAMASARYSGGRSRGYGLVTESENYRIPCITSDLGVGYAPPRSLAALSPKGDCGGVTGHGGPLPGLRILAGLEAALGCQRVLCYTRSGR